MTFQTIWYKIRQFFHINETKRKVVNHARSLTSVFVKVEYERTIFPDKDTIVGSLEYDDEHKYFYVNYPYSLKKDAIVAAKVGLSIKYDKIVSVEAANKHEIHAHIRKAREFRKNANIVDYDD